MYMIAPFESSLKRIFFYCNPEKVILCSRQLVVPWWSYLSSYVVYR